MSSDADDVEAETEAGPPENPNETRVHGSAVALGGEAVMFVGASGAGKSATALEMVALGARLVSDDQVILRRADEGEGLIACPVDGFEGLVEARGIGIIKVNKAGPTPLGLIVDLDQTEIRRMPPDRFIEFLGIRVNLIYGKDNGSLAAALVAGMSAEI